MNDTQGLIQRIHDSPQQTVLAVAGAGSQAVAWLLGVGGASRTLLEVVVPYGSQSMIELVGHEPAQFVSAETARDIASATYRRSLRLREGTPPVLGLGCTATIATDRTKRGEHRAHVATWDENHVSTYSLLLDKGRRERAEEEEVVSLLVLQALAEACGIDAELELGLSDADDLVVVHEDHPGPLDRLLSGFAGSVTVYPDGRMAVDEPVRGALLPGSFRPVHQGHTQLAGIASEMLGADVCYELSVVNVDKPALTREEVEQRLQQFAGNGTVVLTRAETFHKKSALFPGSAFVIGWDTAVRLVAPRYYGDDETAMLTALAEIWARGCRFLVAGRREGNSFHTLADVPVPQGFAPLFQEVPESAFRNDISSSELRAQES